MLLDIKGMGTHCKGYNVKETTLKNWILNFIIEIVVSYKLMGMKVYYFLHFKGKINMANQWKLEWIISIETKDFSFNTKVHVLKFKIVSHWPCLYFPLVFPIDYPLILTPNIISEQ